MRKIYVPGDEIERNVRFNPIALRKEGGKVYANVVGTVDGENFIPFELPYLPHVGDTIVGVVYDKKPNVYFVDTNSSFSGLIIARDLRGAELDVGNVIAAKITKVEENAIILGDVKILRGGKIFTVPPSKVPRIIGRAASMVKMIKEATNTNIFVGASGYVWVSGEKVDKAVMAIKMITRMAHLEGLTDEVKKFLEVE